MAGASHAVVTGTLHIDARSQRSVTPLVPDLFFNFTAPKQPAAGPELPARLQRQLAQPADRLLARSTANPFGMTPPRSTRYAMPDCVDTLQVYATPGSPAVTFNTSSGCDHAPVGLRAMDSGGQRRAVR